MKSIFLFATAVLLIISLLFSFKNPDNKKADWSLVNPYGIQMDINGDVWRGGRVVGTLVNNAGAIIAASETSGIWLIPENGSAISLSKNWENPDVQCLAFGPDNENHVYAGCRKLGDAGSAPVLYVTDISKQLPLLQPWKTVTVPNEVGSIYQITVLKNLRRIVLACEGGVYWSNIPKPNGIYSWIKVSGLPDGRFFGVTAGPQNTIVVSAWGSDISKSLYGIFYGKWVLSGRNPATFTQSLEFKRAKITGFNEQEMGRTTIGASETNPEKMYALSVNGNGTPNAVLKSADGGINWKRMEGNVSCSEWPSDWEKGGKNLTNAMITGDIKAGAEIHRISVSRTNSDLIAYGGLFGYYSKDGGNNWDFIKGCNWDASTGLHADVHEIYFDRTDRMIIASDGGIAITSDFGQTINSKCNEKLANLQWYGKYGRGFYGGFHVTYDNPGLIGGGLQDNGNVYGPTKPGITPWKYLDGGDGGTVMFIRTGLCLYSNNNEDFIKYATLDNYKSELFKLGQLPFRDPRKLPFKGLDSVGYHFAYVNSPQFRNAAGQLMYVISAQPDKLFGFFSNADGSDAHWELIASWLLFNGEIEAPALTSPTGKQIFVSVRGPKGPGIWRITPSLETLSDLGGGFGSGYSSGKIDYLGALPPQARPKPGEDFTKSVITHLFAENDKVIYAISNNIENPRGCVLRSEDGGASWQMIFGRPNEGVYDLETDWTTSPNIIYVCTDKHVYVSNDSGKSWNLINQGLPKLPHCADLSFVVNPDGKRYLYLGTYGWSVWRTPLN